MPQAFVELRDLRVDTDIGTYGPGDVVPTAHLLDLTLRIDAGLAVIDADGMDRVFDYDPLVAELLRIAGDGHYHTQERVLTRMLVACAAEPAIQGAEIVLRKHPVAHDSGSLGVRVHVDAADLAQLRAVAGDVGT